MSRRVVRRAEETSTYSLSGFCTVNCRLTASNYQLSHLRPCQEPNPGLRGGRRECYHSATVAPFNISKHKPKKYTIGRQQMVYVQNVKSSINLIYYCPNLVKELILAQTEYRRLAKRHLSSAAFVHLHKLYIKEVTLFSTMVAFVATQTN